MARSPDRTAIEELEKALEAVLMAAGQQSASGSCSPYS